MKAGVSDLILYQIGIKCLAATYGNDNGNSIDSWIKENAGRPQSAAANSALAVKFDSSGQPAFDKIISELKQNVKDGTDSGPGIKYKAEIEFRGIKKEIDAIYRIGDNYEILNNFHKTRKISFKAVPVKDIRNGKQLTDLQSQMKTAQESKNYAEADRLEAEIANIRKTAPQTLDALGKGVYADNILAMKMAEGAVEARRKREEAQTKALLAESSAREKQEKAASKTLGKGAALGTDGTQTKPAPAKRTYSQKQALRQVIGSISRDMSAKSGNIDYQSKLTDVIKITSDKFADVIGNIKELSKRIKQIVKDRFYGKTFVNKNDGRKIKVEQLSEMFHRTNAEKLIASEALDKIIENGQYDHSAPDDSEHPHQGVKNWHYYKTPVNIDGVNKIIEFSVKEMKNGDFYYNHIIREIPAATGSLTDGRDLLSNNITEDGQNVKQSSTTGGRGDSFRGAFLNREQIILFGELADASTLPHEFGHYWVQNNFKWQRSGLASEEFKRRWAAVERYLGIKEYDQFLSNRASEKFARAYEQFLGTEKVPLLYAGQDGVDDEAVKEALI